MEKNDGNWGFTHSSTSNDHFAATLPGCQIKLQPTRGVTQGWQSNQSLDHPSARLGINVSRIKFLVCSWWLPLHGQQMMVVKTWWLAKLDGWQMLVVGTSWLAHCDQQLVIGNLWLVVGTLQLMTRGWNTVVGKWWLAHGWWQVVIGTWLFAEIG